MGAVLSLSSSTEKSNPTVDETFRADVLEGLSSCPKHLSCKYLYDERGSQLFDKICELPEYYPTRTEQRIMERYAAEMADQLGEQVMLIEFGSGSGTKTRVLLDHLIDPVAYVPLDISEEHLLKTAEVLQQDYPEIEVLPLVADFTQKFDLPKSRRPSSHAAIYFPGSTIGNFSPEGAFELLEVMAGELGPEGGLLIGIDLEKDKDVIEAAYNDSQGVTAAFTLNLLHRINAELDGNFALDQFHHKAVYNQEFRRIETFIVSRCRQRVSIAGEPFDFDEDEHILTEYSHKYTVDRFARLASKAGFAFRSHWTDKDQLFAVLHLVSDSQ